MPIIIKDIEQGTQAWLDLKCGVASTSNFSDILTTKGVRSVTYSKYLDRLFDERITGEPTKTYKSKHMDRGNKQEPEACKTYEFIYETDVEHVAFVFLDESRKIGYSPDGLIGSDGIVEIKTALPHIQRDRIENGWSLANHKQQIQGGLWISERAWCDRISYCRNMDLVVDRIYRDEDYIKKIKIETAMLINDLNKMVSKYKI